jgi:hypothetical protein
MMHSIRRKGLRIYRPRYLRSGIEGGEDSARSYPSPTEMFSSIGAVILIALCVGLAADLLANTLIR